MFLLAVYCLTFLSSKFLGIERTTQILKKSALSFRRFKKSSLSLETIEGQLQRSLHRVPFATKCLDQALVAWFYLNLNRHPATLKIGLSITPLESHAWVTAGNRTFVDTYNLSDLTVVAEYLPF